MTTKIIDSFNKATEPALINRMLDSLDDNFASVQNTDDLAGYLIGRAAYSGVLSEQFIQAVENVVNRINELTDKLDKSERQCEAWKQEVNHTQNNNNELFKLAVQRARRIGELEAEVATLKATLAEKEQAKQDDKPVKYGSLHGIVGVAPAPHEPQAWAASRSTRLRAHRPTGLVPA